MRGEEGRPLTDEEWAALKRLWDRTEPAMDPVEGSRYVEPAYWQVVAAGLVDYARSLGHLPALVEKLRPHRGVALAEVMRRFLPILAESRGACEKYGEAIVHEVCLARSYALLTSEAARDAFRQAVRDAMGLDAGEGRSDG